MAFQEAQAALGLVGRMMRLPSLREESEKEKRQSWLSPSRRLQASPKNGKLPGEIEEEEERPPPDPFHLMTAAGVDFDAVELADSVEKGLRREIVTEFVTPVRSQRGLRRFNVLRSQDSREHRLFSDDYNFLLFAHDSPEASRMELFGYDPKEQDQPFDPSRPAFTMSYNSNKTEWRLVQERCEYCQFSPKHLKCCCKGKQQVAYIRHFSKKLGQGVCNCMEVKVPGLGDDGSPVVWCPRLRKGDLASPSSRSKDSDEAQSLVTKLPAWNEEFQCLVLSFEGRTVMASPSNFQLALPDRPDEVVCQYGKIGPTTFSLDFKEPLSMVQAFSIALSATFLT